LSWKETAEAFDVSWEAVYRSVLLNKAVDQVRRGERAALRGGLRGKRLKKTRWLLLRPRTRVCGKARERLDAVIHSNLRRPGRGP